MFFGKSKETQPQTLKVLEWPDADRKYQRIRFVVQKYCYSVSCSYGQWTLDLEGTAATEPLSGLLVSASLELLSPFETPGRLRDAWKTLPERIEGTCRLQQSESPFHPPQFNATLYCEKPALESILRTAMLASSPTTAVVVDLEFDFPDPIVGDFWREAWRTKELRVRNWRIICETK